VPHEPDLLKHFDYCYERSIGCVGVLKDWLTRALAVALADSSATITRKIIERTAWSVDQAARMAKDALEGEADLTECDESRGRLRKLLGLDSLVTLSSGSSIPSPDGVSAASRRGGRVGQRLPVRDAVGAREGALHAG